MRRVALFGMPNCGKSSLFNRLTGKRAHVGNRVGVTVEKELGVIRLADGSHLSAVDLPGIRSMSPVSADERETLRCLCEDPPDILLFVCDATDFARQYALLCGLSRFLCARKETAAPRMAAVFNFCDELEFFPNSGELTHALGIPSVAISARTGCGIAELKDFLLRLASEEGAAAPHCFGCGQYACESLEKTLNILGQTSRYALRRGAWLDRLLLRPITGIPLFFVLMCAVLFLVFGDTGERLSNTFQAFVSAPLRGFFERILAAAPTWLRALVTDGILGGVGAVLDFLPRLMLLFLLQSLLEQSGLLSRFARLFDKPLSHFGLRGDAMTALLLGFGCTVPAVLCTRAMKNENAARRCACCLPVIACSARMPLCLALAACYFGGMEWLICGAVWLLGVLCFLLFCAVSNLFSVRRVQPEIHDDPLPRLRLPSVRQMLAATSENLKHFLGRAGGVILLCSVAVWLLSSFDPRLRFVGEIGMQNSLLAHMGRLIAPLFAPMGLDSWQIVAALLTGVGAKEATLSTLGVLLGGGEGVSFSDALAASGWLDPASALALTVFYSLYFPCAATLAAFRAEKHPLRFLPLMTAFAYLLACLTYRLAGLFL